MSKLFELRESLTKSQKLYLGLGGVALFLFIWIVLTSIKTDIEASDLFVLTTESGNNFTTEIEHTIYQDKNYNAIQDTDEPGVPGIEVTLNGLTESGDSIALTSITDNEGQYQFNNLTPGEYEVTYPSTAPLVKPGILPHPMRVLRAFGDLYRDNNLIQNTFKSIGINVAGYVVAIAIALPIGFIIGLFGFFRGAFKPHVDAIRFVPLTAVTGLFIVWFGIGTSMKVYFLAFGILIYLLPTIVVRLDEVDDVYLKTVYTLGANAWQTIKTVYIPAVISRISDDIRVLTAISWTYIIVAEGIGDQGGLGSLIFRSGQRMGRVDKTFAILVLIILIGVFQDRIFSYLDRTFFPYKYQKETSYEEAKSLRQVSVFDTIFDYTVDVLTWITLALYVIFTLDEIGYILGGIKPLSYLFGGTVWVVHLIFGIILIYKVRKLIYRYQEKK